MQLRSTLTLFLILLGLFTQAQNNGMGTTSPTHTLHIKPDANNPNPDPIRLENLQKYEVEGDSTLLVVDPATGVLRYMTISQILSMVKPDEDPWYSVLSSSPASSNTEDIYTLGKIGVGINSPEAEIDIDGSMRLRLIPTGNETDEILTTDSLGNLRKRTVLEVVGPREDFFLGNRDQSLQGNRSISTEGFKLNFDNNTLSVDGGTNRVGIGTNEPLAKLQITGSDSLTGGLVISNSKDRAQTWFPFTNGSNYLTGDTQVGDGHTIFRVDDGTTYMEHMRLTGEGSLGVGTTNPLAKIQITGNDDQTGGLMISDENDRARTWLPHMNGSNYLTGNITLGAGHTIFRVDDGTSYTEHMRLTSEGRLGIGTSNPRSVFQLRNNVGTDSAGLTSFNDFTDYQVLLHQSGSNSRNSYGLGIEGSTLALNSNRDYDFNIRGADKMTLNLTGLGIGLSGPRASLDVHRGTGTWGTMALRGTDRVTHFHHSEDEHTYIRGGKSTSNILLNDNGGNVGVGTNRPTYKFQVGGGTNVSASISTTRENGDATLYLGTPNGSVERAQKTAIIAEGLRSWSRAKLHFALEGTSGDNSSAANADISDAKMTIQYNGNVGIGTTAPASKFQVRGNVDSQRLASFTSRENRNLHLIAPVGGAAPFIFYTNNGFDFQTDGFSRITVRDNGRVGINTNAPTQNLSVNGSAGKPGGGAWATFSDARVKENIRPFTDGLTEVLQIQPKSFSYNGKGGYAKDGKTYYGIIAQEIQQIAPYMVEEIGTEDFPDQLSYDGTALVYMLVNAIKEQQAEMDSQQQQIQALQTQNDTLKKVLTEMEGLKAEVEAIKATLTPEYSASTIKN
ncbi:MAG: tail fiber domain-containing protein [Bacteroidota bacterium]